MTNNHEIIPQPAENRSKTALFSTTAGTLVTVLLLTVVTVSAYPLIRTKLFRFSDIHRWITFLQNAQNDPFSLSNMSDQSALLLHGYLTRNIQLVFLIGCTLIIVIALFALFIPYKKQSEAGIVRRFNTMDFEWKFIVFPLLFSLPFLFGISVVDQMTGPYFYGRILLEAKTMYFAIGVPITFLLALYEYLLITAIKGMTALGFRRGFWDNSFLLRNLGKLAAALWRSISPPLLELIRVDIKKNYFRKLSVFFGILIAFFLLCLWILMPSSDPIELILLMMILSVTSLGLMFSVAYRFLKHAEYLTRETEKMSEGNLDLEVREDLGVLSEIAKNLNHIREGFQKAILEETKSQRIKTDLITNVSHDLKTPLTSILNYADLLMNQAADETVRKEYVNIIYSKSKHLQLLIEDLFEVSKASSGNIELHLETLDIVALLLQAYGEFEDKWTAKNLKTVLRLPEEKISCLLDGQRTHRIFENLFHNIEKYAQPNTRIYIEGEINEEFFVIFLKNIASYEMDFSGEEIFERFVRGDKSRNTEGSGLGLAIASSLMQLQQGRMDITVDGDLFKVQLQFRRRIS